MSETELQLREQMSAEEAAALKIQKCELRVGKNLNLYQQGKDMASSWLDESSSSSPRNAAAKTRSQSYFSEEDFEPLVGASATLKPPCEFSSSFQEIASKAKPIEGRRWCRAARTRWRAPGEQVRAVPGRVADPSSSSSGARTDVVVPWGVLPGCCALGKSLWTSSRCKSPRSSWRPVVRREEREAPERLSQGQQPSSISSPRPRCLDDRHGRNPCSGQPIFP